jgi:hypothetical protein
VYNVREIIILLNSNVATEDKTDDVMGGACCTNVEMESALGFGNLEGKRPL